MFRKLILKLYEVQLYRKVKVKFYRVMDYRTANEPVDFYKEYLNGCISEGRDSRVSHLQLVGFINFLQTIEFSNGSNSIYFIEITHFDPNVFGIFTVKGSL